MSYQKLDDRQRRINRHEANTRKLTEFICSKLWERCAEFKGEDTPVDCHIDYIVTAKTTNGRLQTADIEVKTIQPKYAENGTPLKISKYNNMLKDHHNQLLLYLSIEDGGTAYIYNLSDFKIDEVARQAIWHLKKVEWLPESEENPKVPTPMYIIPKEYAKYKIKLTNYTYANA
jgi:hypothetical protein